MKKAVLTLALVASYPLVASYLLAAAETQAETRAKTPRLLWGDLHVHSNNSFDAFLNGNRTATPETAYRYARGEPVIHPSTRVRVQIDRPLDFIAVTDHAEFYGVARQAVAGQLTAPENASLLDKIKLWGTRHFIRLLVSQMGSSTLFEKMLPKGSDPRRFALEQPAGAPVDTSAVERSAWLDAIDSAERFNEPGRFSTLFGWEWSSTPGGANLHRVVVSDASAHQARDIRPFSAVDSPFPEDLWRWLDNTGTERAINFVSIPHNSNISKGYMFDLLSLRGEPIDAVYAGLRQRLEPVAEITQIKGDSETHPLLSTDDEFADFEHYGWYMQQNEETYLPREGDFLRSALLRGLKLESGLGINPYRLGFIGSSDSHTALSSVVESDFQGKHANQARPEDKGETDGGQTGPSGWSMSAAGLAAIWATDNSRDAIIEALQRREVYATTGPRIALQMFASAGFGELDLNAPNVIHLARERGIPMGGKLPAPLAADPEFLIMAQRDPNSAGLHSLQIIKGWLTAEGETREQVFTLAQGHRKGEVHHVDRKTGRYDSNTGAKILISRWRDPDFDPKRPAFYYARVLEMPTPRHLLLDAIALGLTEPKEGASIIQERAYGSPIWYQPQNSAQNQ